MGTVLIQALGAAVFGVGLGLIYLPAAVLYAGLVLFAVGWLVDGEPVEGSE